MKWFLVLGVVATVACSAAPAPREPALVLRVADSLPHGHVIHKTMTEPFMDEVRRLSRDAIAFQHYPGEQLGKAKDMLELTTGGLAEIGYVVPAYHSDRMPLTQAMELPGVVSSYCAATRGLWELTHGDGYLAREEFGPNGVLPLVTFVLPSYQLLLATGKQVNSAADLKGLKVRSAGGAMDFLPRHLQMVPVRMTPPDTYQALSRGTIDGAILPYQSALSYKLGAVLSQGTVGATFGTIVLTYAIGRARWERLPQDARDVLLEAGRRTSLTACERLTRAEEESLSSIRRDGLRPIAWDATLDPGLAGAFDAVQQEWASGLDRRGRPGSLALAAVKQAVAVPQNVQEGR